MEKEEVKQKIRDLSKKLLDAEKDWEKDCYEMDLVVLIIDYAIDHQIQIPLVDYQKYKALCEPPEEIEETPKSTKRRKIDQPGDEGEIEYNYMDDFFEAIGEKHLTNPRFTLPSEIQELVDCWSVNYDF